MKPHNVQLCLEEIMPSQRAIEWIYQDIIKIQLFLWRASLPAMDFHLCGNRKFPVRACDFACSLGLGPKRKRRMDQKVIQIWCGKPDNISSPRAWFYDFCPPAWDCNKVKYQQYCWLLGLVITGVTMLLSDALGWLSINNHLNKPELKWPHSFYTHHAKYQGIPKKMECGVSQPKALLASGVVTTVLSTVDVKKFTFCGLSSSPSSVQQLVLTTCLRPGITQSPRSPCPAMPRRCSWLLDFLWCCSWDELERCRRIVQKCAAYADIGYCWMWAFLFDLWDSTKKHSIFSSCLSLHLIDYCAETTTTPEERYRVIHLD